ncbi:SurA N-terminal domain-containing protein [Stakelama sp. CBK3Z-3]|uniref:SurA N-terminal domain-containing protein n=1 Tax=Stakelama flava TaxID=2860338 RepID=A0ABS6XIQ2_9SPHN|nr:peptidylprolyl isomerase [Stakelama flava]MBW4329296.1 SurA N-terminal domain-containing protein [Stakelama flava]
MLSFLRRLTHSKVGVIVTMTGLVVIALAFGLTSIGSSMTGGAPAADTVAKVGGEAVTTNEFRERIQQAVDSARQRNPDITMAQFIAQGGVDQVLGQVVNSIALDKFGHDSGMVVSQKVVDGEIASIPAFQGIDGKFSQEQFDQLLKARGITADQVRGDIRRELMAQWLMAPTAGARQFPKQIALPYAALLLEERHGTIGLIPTAALAQGDKPDDKQIQAYYKQNIADYTIPQRRVIRYAIVTPDSVAGQAQPSDVEIAQAYKAAGARFQATQKRTVQAVVVSDQKQAQQVAQKIASGTSVDAAAKAIGLEASHFDTATQADLAKQSSDELAAAAFKAKEGGAIGPVKAALGWYVGKVTGVVNVPGKSLAEARPELTGELKQQKVQQALADLQDKINDGILDGSTFDELVKDNGALKAAKTPPVLANGTNPENPDQAPAPQLSHVIEAGFAAQQGDSPQLVQVGDDGGFALVALGNVVQKQAKPLNAIKQQVESDLIAHRASEKARKLAADAVAKIKKGTSVAQAVRDSGVAAPPPQKVDLARGDLARQQGKVPPPVVMLFSMTEGDAKLIQAPDNQGYFVVKLDKIDRKDASDNKDLVNGTQQGLGTIIGNELADQFARAVRRDVGVKQNPQAVAKISTELGGNASAAD